MTKAELIERIARSRSLPKDITKKDVEKIVTLAFEEIASFFAKAKVTRTQSPKFSFPHFGTFVKKRRSARRGVNPRTLEPMTIEAFYSLDFRNSSELRESMNRVRIEPESSTRRSKRAASEPDAIEVPAADVEVAIAPEHDEQLPAAPLQRVRTAAGGGRVRSA